MLAGFSSWWIARITELLPRSWTDAHGGATDGVIIDVDPRQNVTYWIRHKGRLEAVTFAVAARLGARRPVLLRPPPSVVLEKQHTVPAASRPELDQMLRHELARITPFKADDLFWRWDGRPKIGDKRRTNVVMTLVPKATVAPALDMLASLGIRPRFIETGGPDRPRLLTIEKDSGRRNQLLTVRVLAGTCGVLAIIALALPVVLQALALRATDGVIADLQPVIKQVEALRHVMTADGAGGEVLARERARTGDVLQVLATVTRILPDDTYLTDFALRDRQMTIGGRSAAAARLITRLSADSGIRNAAFAAPVTRIEGATIDSFSIRAGIAP